tara:strand:+ start:226 stop:474 length:249 start_codon:yes stop_codon:yes gene_type:complete
MSDGPKLHVRKKLDERPTLKQAQQLVAGGGLVQLVTLANDDQMLVDEEGLLKNLPPNYEASKLAGIALVGDALLLQGEARWD